MKTNWIGLKHKETMVCDRQISFLTSILGWLQVKAMDLR